MAIDKDELIETVGTFTWFWSWNFFIETRMGNFHWKNPNYGGDNTMTPFDGDIDRFRRYLYIQVGRNRGSHLVGEFCGTEFTIVIPKKSESA